MPREAEQLFGATGAVVDLGGGDVALVRGKVLEIFHRDGSSLTRVSQLVVGFVSNLVVEADGNRLLVVSNGCKVLDISDRASPTVVAEFPAINLGPLTRLSPDRLLAPGSVIIDRETFEPVGTVDGLSPLFVLVDNLVVTAEFSVSGTSTVVDVSDPTAPVTVSELPLGLRAAAHDGRFVYAVGPNDTTFRIVDLTDATAPRLRGELPNILGGEVRAAGHGLVVAQEVFGDGTGIDLTRPQVTYFIDVSDADAPVLRATGDTRSLGFNSITVVDADRFVATDGLGVSIATVDDENVSTTIGGTPGGTVDGLAIADERLLVSTTLVGTRHQAIDAAGAVSGDVTAIGDRADTTPFPRIRPIAVAGNGAICVDGNVYDGVAGAGGVESIGTPFVAATDHHCVFDQGGSHRILVVDVSEPSEPVEAADLFYPFRATTLQSAGDKVYVASPEGLLSFDVNALDTPVITEGNFSPFAVDGDVLLTMEPSTGFIERRAASDPATVVDTVDATSAGLFSGFSSATTMMAAGGFVFVFGDYGITVLGTQGTDVVGLLAPIGCTSAVRRGDRFLFGCQTSGVEVFDFAP